MLPGPDLAAGAPDGRCGASDRPKPRPPAQGPHKAADPVYGRRFDPWNSVGLGHQRAETAGPTGWRESRTAKLGSQFRAGHGGGQRISDSVGAGSKDFDKRLGMVVSKEVRARAANSVLDMLRHPPARAKHPVSPTPTCTSAAASSAIPPPSSQPALSSSACTDTTAPQGGGVDMSDPFGYGVPQPHAATRKQSLAARPKAGDEAHEDMRNKPRGIFDGLVVYVNGSTHPQISDHRLKHVLAENGARMAIHLGRRQVTHVILGRPASSSSASAAGSGGGLAASKLEREILRTRGCGIKYVDVGWVLESIKAGRRLPEARFPSLKIASGGQQSVYGAFSRAATRPEPTAAAAKGNTSIHNGS